MDLRPPTGGQSRLVTLAAVAAVVAGLYLARDLLIPLALATLVSFLLAPLVSLFERSGLSRILSVLLVVVVAAMPLVIVGWVAVAQFIDLANSLPYYRSNIQEKLNALQAPAGGWLERAIQTVRELGLEQTAADPEPTPEGEAPVPVTLVEPPAAPLQVVAAVVGPLAGPVAALGIVIVVVIFMLIQREDLRDRMIRLISPGQLTVTTQALAEIGTRISRYLRTQLLLNIGFGFLVSIGLLLIGVPNALLWGFLSVGLRFIPYAGPVLSASMPILLSLAVSDGWTIPLLTIGLFITLEAISGNFFEPWLYGTTTGISSLALLLAAVFWTWLWGVPGLLLSTPMTVCLAVAGRYVPQLSFLSVLLGAEPAMDPQMRFYQRLLAMDYEEASDIAADYLEKHTLAEVCDDLLIPALRAADDDAERRVLDDRRRQFISMSMRDLIDELAHRAARVRAESQPEAPAAPPAPAGPAAPPGADVVVVEPRDPSLAPASPEAARRVRVLFIPARDEADVLAGHMLGYLLATSGITVRTLSLEDMGTDLSQLIADAAPDLVCISSVPPFAATQARLRLRQVRLKAREVRMIVGLWGIQEGALRSRERLLAAGAESVVFAIGEAVSQIPVLLRNAPRPEPAAAPSPGGGPPDSSGADPVPPPSQVRTTPEDEPRG